MTRGADDEQAQAAFQERSFHELEAGRLPLRAQERLASMAADGAFTSDLSVAEHHAIRAVGFVPLGQVMGASVFQIGYTGGWDCGVRYGGYGRYGSGGGLTNGMVGGGIAGGTSWAGSAGQVRTVEVTPWQRALVEAQQRAVARMEQETQLLGGDGVVAVRFTEHRVANGAVEFLVIGTAVRAAGGRHPGSPFTCDLSGQDFSRLLHAGYQPTRLLFGVAVLTRHDDWQTRMGNRSWQNVELAGYTQLVTDARAAARLSFAREAARVGSTVAVLSTHDDRVTEHECALVEGGHDHVMRSTFIGTGVVSATRSPRQPDVPAPLPIMRLADRRPASAAAARQF